MIDLHKQEKTIREIAKEVHMSFSDIGAIIKREFGSEKLELSRDAQVLKLFAKGTKMIDIAIKFNVSANEVKRLHREYRDLCGMEELNKIYNAHGDEIESFVQLYKAGKEQGLSTEEIINSVRYANDLPILELKYDKVKDEVREIEDRKQNLISEIQNLDDTSEISRNVITSIDQVLNQKRKEVKSLEYEKQKLQNTILWMMGFKEYKKIKSIARQQIETSLNDKRALLMVALVSTIEAVKLDPEKQILFSNIPRDTNGQSYYLEQQRKQLLELSEHFFNKFANDIVNMTISTFVDKQAVSFPISS